MKRMDQQCNITYALSLNHLQSIAWSITVCQSHIASAYQNRTGCWQIHSCSIA